MGWFSIRLVALLALLAVVQHADADSRSPYKRSANLRHFERNADKSIIAGYGKISLHIPGQGRVKASFDQKRMKNWSASVSTAGRSRPDLVEPLLLRGKISGRSERDPRPSMPVAASIIGKELKLHFVGRAKRSQQRIYTIRVQLDGSVVVHARVASVPVKLLGKTGCASVEPVASSAAVPAVHEAAPVLKQVRELTISTDADEAWYAKYGERSNAEIAAILNAAETIYRDQLGIVFRIVHQHVYSGSSPYTALNAGMMLNQLVTNGQNSEHLALPGETVAVKHLFTGKELDGSVVGIAYIGVICSAPGISYGLTQDFAEGVNFGIFAHELAHNFGASHDTTDRGGLMYPSISVPPSNYFSAVSHQEINAHVAEYGSCLGITERDVPESTATPVPNPNTPPEIPELDPTPSVDPADTYITLFKERLDGKQPVVKLFGRVKRWGGEPYVRMPVQLRAGDTVIAEARTRSNGGFAFYVQVNLPTGMEVVLQVATTDTSILSNAVSLRRSTLRRSRRGG